MSVGTLTAIFERACHEIGEMQDPEQMRRRAQQAITEGRELRVLIATGLVEGASVESTERLREIRARYPGAVDDPWWRERLHATPGASEAEE